MSTDRLPPGQQLAARGKWPVVGERQPLAAIEPWSVTVDGLVAQPRRWTLEELQQLPATEKCIDIHCVTRWSLLDVPVKGVELKALLAQVNPSPRARYVSFVAHTERHHSTSLPLEESLSLGAMVVWSMFGRPLPVDHGGPVRMVVPGKYFYKSVKWLSRIELLEHDRLGYWEAEAGYHNGADPWREERFAAPGISKQQMQKLLATRDWSEQSLLALQASGRELVGLVARGAVLRAADFRQARLQQANFEGANLSNSRFGEADLRAASFLDADIEGCDFSGADLRGCDLRSLSMLGVTFVSLSGTAVVDETTRFRDGLLDQLADEQADFVRSRQVSIE